LAFDYISQDEIQNLVQQSEEVGRLLNHVIEKPGKIWSSIISRANC
jgi:hypothetical protein